MDVVNAHFGTLLAVVHYSSVALIGAVAMTSTLRIRWKSLLSMIGVSFVLLATIIFLQQCRAT